MKDLINEKKEKFRPVAVPLVTVDPYFSIWSYDDELYNDYTRHWTGKINPMFAGVLIDNEYFAVMGKAQSEHRKIVRLTKHLDQISLKVFPLKTEYVFANDMVKLTLSFITPLLPQRLDILARPVSYIEYNIEITDNKSHNVKFVFGISGECCVDTWEQNVKFGKTSISSFVKNAVQNVLSKSGDDVCIDWGYLHVADSEARFVENINVHCLSENIMYSELNENEEYNAYGRKPYIYLEKESLNGVVTLAYDEISPIEYFGKKLKEYYTKYFDSFEDMLKTAIAEYDEIKILCDEFNNKFLDETKKFGEKYSNVTALAFRQVIAAHKLTADSEGNILFLSKECYSNGCIGTLDVTYPSIPMLLKYNPELVLGMLRPIIKYAQSDDWSFDFAPHDVGQYPLANGQVYGYDSEKKVMMHDRQMPVEECGNMIICVAACAKAMKNNDFVVENKEILKKWADYLIKAGYNPENQLCTDDFAGHLAQNCNLSIKAIVGIAACAKLFGEEEYMKIAKTMAEKWEQEATCDYGSKLAFNQENTWSLKYNIVWDKLLNLGLFSESIYEKEIELYTSKLNRYGVPMDSRADYTKIDWLMWTTVMTDNEDYFNKIVSAIYDMITTTHDRAPITDWYNTITGKEVTMHNRTVLGGIFINMLK